MAASWHTMTVISCPVFFCSHHWFLLGINTLVLGGKLGSSWPPPHTVGLQTGPPARIPRVWPFLHLLWNVTKALWKCKRKENLANMRQWGTAGACSPYTAKKHKEGLGSYSLPGFVCVGYIVLVWSGLTKMKWAWATRSHHHCPSISPFCRSPLSQLHMWLGWRMEGKQTRGGVTASASQA